MLRIISGKYKRRMIKQPCLTICRPTKNIVKEAIFSMIQFKIENSIILDLFSGSGSIAIEASSRKAMKIIAIESNSQCYSVIKENIKKLNITNIEAKKIKVNEYLKNIKGTKFDFIFLDPPYKETNLYNETLKQIKEKNILKNEGQIIMESTDINKIKIPKGFMIQKTKKYGKTNIFIISTII